MWETCPPGVGARSGESRNGSHKCWNSPEDCVAPARCYVKSRIKLGGFAQCRETCPSDWLCETREPGVRPGSGSCGAGPMPARLVEPTADMVELVARAPSAGRLTSSLRLCDRSAPPLLGPHPTFEITCFDGGFTGNRYMMVKAMLQRADCCGGVALLPPSFDGFPQTGASCLDFRRHGDLQPADWNASACRATRTSSKGWWGAKMGAPPKICDRDRDSQRRVRLAAALYAGVGVAGRAFGQARHAPYTPLIKPPYTPHTALHRGPRRRAGV